MLLSTVHLALVIPICSLTQSPPVIELIPSWTFPLNGSLSIRPAMQHYDKPSGSCTYDGKELTNCYCQNGDTPFIGLIHGKVGAAICIPSCGKGECPQYDPYYWQRKCVEGQCFLECVLEELQNTFSKRSWFDEDLIPFACFGFSVTCRVLE
ncbi:hypothetical protein FOL47_007227 [Perkinsus chesapeaki]|uniref:Uncharacterized protein n=1 Tax=Perkinsus chesapeaki TaxID=330153 RepID=A0A7J6MY41_PERCH|nr:hypothetical protein FOL47_007227 [Perkinsus chesapeaki]